MRQGILPEHIEQHGMRRCLSFSYLRADAPPGRARDTKVVSVGVGVGVGVVVAVAVAVAVGVVVVVVVAVAVAVACCCCLLLLLVACGLWFVACCLLLVAMLVTCVRARQKKINFDLILVRVPRAHQRLFNETVCDKNG